MTGLEAFRTLCKRAKQHADGDRELDETLQIVEELITTVEQAEAEPYATRMLAEDVLASIGNKIVDYIGAYEIRGFLTDAGFLSLARNLSNEEIVWELDYQLSKPGEPVGCEEWLKNVAEAAARAFVKRAGLDWPKPEK